MSGAGSLFTGVGRANGASCVGGTGTAVLGVGGGATGAFVGTVPAGTETGALSLGRSAPVSYVISTSLPDSGMCGLSLPAAPVVE